MTAMAVPHAVPECLSPVPPAQDSALTSRNQWQLLAPLLAALLHTHVPQVPPVSGVSLLYFCCNSNSYSSWLREQLLR